MELAESSAEKTLISWAYRVIGTPEEVAEFRRRLPRLILECTGGGEKADIPISGLGMSSSTVASIRDHGIETIGGLLQMTEDDLRMWCPFSWAKLKEVKYALQRLGLKLKEPPKLNEQEANKEEEESALVDLATIRLTRVDAADFSVRTSNCLRNLGIETVEQLLEWTEEGLLSTRHFGRKSLVEIQEWLKKHNLELAAYPPPLTPSEES